MTGCKTVIVPRAATGLVVLLCVAMQVQAGAPCTVGVGVLSEVIQGQLVGQVDGADGVAAGAGTETVPAGGRDRLAAPYPIRWRGESVGDLLPEVARDLGVAYVLDGSVTEEDLGQRLRLEASHLSGEHVVRWLARLAGLCAVRVEDAFLVAKPERLPVLWRAAGRANTVPPPSPSSMATRHRWEQAQSRRVEIAWVDLPLSAVARNIASAFGVDVIFHPSIQVAQPLVSFRSESAGIREICQTLADKFNARVDFVDGAVWVHPADQGPPLAVEAAQTAAKPAPETDDPVLRRMPTLAREVGLTQDVRSWVGWGERLASACEAASRVEVPPGARYPAIEARGTVREILEAARLLGRVKWQSIPGRSDRAGTLHIQVRQKDR